MVHGAHRLRFRCGREKNKAGTYAIPIPLPARQVNGRGNGIGDGARQGCGFIAADAVWRYGDPDPFCNAPVLAGSSYCAVHAQRCAVAAASSAGRAAAAALAEEAERAPDPPPELGFLAAAAVAEAAETLSDTDIPETRGIGGETAAERE